ncbi:hypothetical protein SAMN02745866_01111 [Alteromonadaceae bacterium Bs31]|nr:hypothetical protein SAMN02745866_01111 [Alteromonadaceae bacterium Bs31]
MERNNLTIAFVFSLVSTLISLSIFINALSGDNGLRISLSAVGFVIFLSLFGAVVFTILRKPSSQ